jgi:hypothetical protein
MCDRMQIYNIMKQILLLLIIVRVYCLIGERNVEWLNTVNTE